ncbi:MAG: aspartate carbamoyltransferase catalytic subunit [Planctomycetota bacterium]
MSSLAPCLGSQSKRARTLISVRDLSRDEVETLLDRAAFFRSGDHTGLFPDRSVATMFFENSTRTRCSFERAAQRLGAQVLTFESSSSSTSKGESLVDTAQTIDALGVNAIIVRHKSVGAPGLIDRSVRAPVINAGEGSRAHPSQALLDALTIRDRLGGIEGLRIAIVGDVLHSRVARSNVALLMALGARVVLVGPRSLVPSRLAEALGVPCAHDLQEGLGWDGGVDVVYVLRIQLERMSSGFVTTRGAYARGFGVTPAALASAAASRVRLVMHPGPMNRGVEIDPRVLLDDRCAVGDQVANGAPVRMALLERAFTGGSGP